MVTHTRYSLIHRIAAWSVHFYTALGLPLMYLAAQELLAHSSQDEQDARMFFMWMWLAMVVDSSDGVLARTVRVERVLPEFSGRRLDDIVDFLSFAFLPCVAFGIYELFPTHWEWFAIVPIMASGYGFCREQAKTDNAFVGFPSYWNIVLLYLYLVQMDPWLNLGIVGFLAAMVFVPIHYIYPTRTTFLRPFTLIFGSVWTCVLITSSLLPRAAWTTAAAWLSLSFPLYYLALSIVHHRRVHRDASTSWWSRHCRNSARRVRRNKTRMSV